MHIPLPGEELQAGVGPEKGAEYLGIGQVVRDAILSQTNLSPAGSVLDIGCGSGRMARQFVNHLEPPGRYVGMEIQKRFVDWCNAYIAPANPAFEFYHQDIYNGGYNPKGKVNASEYRFPFEDGSFDAIILYSVFTHLLPEDAANYLREISRLLKPGGYCYSTWYLMTPDVDVRYLLPNAKEGQVGFGFPKCVEIIESAGLRADGFQPGRWNGARTDIWQDLLWLKRTEDAPEPLLPAEVPRVRETGDEPFVSGTLESLDPASSTLTVAGDDGRPRTEVAFSRETPVRVHGAPGALSALRPGQRVRAHYAETPSGKVAVKVAASGQLAPEQIRGIVEAVDPGANLLTLTVLNRGSLSFRMDPEREGANVDGRKARLGDLRVGQVAAVRVVPTVGSVAARSPASGSDG